MATLERDLELLEQYLDGALETAAVSQLETRLKADTELATTLAELKAQRAVRAAVFQTLEPDAAASDRLMWRIRGAMLDQQRTIAVEPKRQWNTWRIASFSSAAAACILLGFMVGRVGHGSNGVAPVTGHDNIAINQNTGSQLVEFKKSDPTAIANNAKISVPITNEYGQVVAWQTFDNADQAKSFTEDLQRTHAQTVAPAASGQTRLVDQQVLQVPF